MGESSEERGQSWVGNDDGLRREERTRSMGDLDAGETDRGGGSWGRRW